MRGNLFSAAPALPDDGEFIETLLSRPGFRIERIVSTGQATPPGSWYDQDQAEWVVLLSGAAELQFEDEENPRVLVPGDWVNIDAHRRHRVNSTDVSHASVWLAIHYSPV
jgi:cupin 2 domain-containing protein